MNKWAKYANKRQRVNFYWNSLTTVEKMEKLQSLNIIINVFSASYSNKLAIYEANNK